MATAFEPKAPAPGWLPRWSNQASELTLRAMPLLLLGTVGFNILVIPIVLLAIGGGSGGNNTIALFGILFAGRGLAMLHLFWVLHVIMKADGHSPEQPLLSRESLRMMLPLYLIEVVLLSIRLIIILGQPAAVDAVPSASPGLFPEGSSELYMAVTIIGWTHAMNMNGMLTMMWIVGMFWAPVMVSMGVKLGTYFSRINSLMAPRLGKVYWTTLAIGLAFVTVVGFLPFWLSQIATLYGLAWIYVGAREIFGGLTENGKQKAFSWLPQPKPASAPSAG